MGLNNDYMYIFSLCDTVANYALCGGYESFNFKGEYLAVAML